MLWRIRFSSLLLLGCVVGAAAHVVGPGRAAAAETVKVGGTGSALGDMKNIADAYMRGHPGTTVIVLPSLGASGGLKALRAGAIDIALIAAEPLSSGDTAAGLTATPYAKTALVLATRSDTPIDAVTSNWLNDVYRGTVTRWPNGKPIRLVLRPAHDSDMKIMFASSEETKRALEAALERPGLLIEDTAQGAGQKLAQLEGSLGSSTLAQIESERLAIKPLAVDGVMPSVETLRSGRYPLVKEFSYVTRADTSAAARDFIAFLKSDAAGSILEQTGNVRISNATRD
jgi:phosphate transport system substrate-binding protein